MAWTINRCSDTFLLDSYTGKGGYLTGDYLVPHAREDGEALKERGAVAIYPNYTADIVNTYQGYLWKKTPSRDAGDGYNRFLRNADGAGNSLDYCLSGWQTLSMIVGTVWIIVDRPQGQPPTRAQQPAPYVALRMPGQVVDCRWDAFGVLESITFVESDMASASALAPAGGPPQTWLGSLVSWAGLGGERRYRHFDRQGWRVSLDAAGKAVLAQGGHGLGLVPVVPLHSSRLLLPGQTRADPWAFGTIQLNWGLYNQVSEKRTLFRKQAFSLLTIPVVDDADAERLKDLTLGTDNALTYNPQGGGQPAYISPQDGPVKNYQADNADLVVQIYKQANLEFIAGVAASGVSLSFQFQKANASMGGLAEQGESCEQGIMRIVSAWEGEQPGRLAYNREFSLADLKTDLAAALDATNLQVSPTFEKELKKKVARSYLGRDASPQTLAEIDAEIDASGDPYGDRLAQQAGTP